VIVPEIGCKQKQPVRKITGASLFLFKTTTIDFEQKLTSLHKPGTS
jgi:hypothetical protein